MYSDFSKIYRSDGRLGLIRREQEVEVMRLGRVSLLAIFLLAAQACLVSALGTDTGRQRKYALLVGCTSYPGLDRVRELVGPENDVELWKGVLTRFYGFADADVVTLTENAGGAEHLPTLMNIRRSFDDLARKASAGDQVVILLAGHGSQQPDADNPPDEADGWDEIFLPRDVGSWDGPRRVVTGALVDDEISQRLAAIAKTGASVWLVVDSCCSGTMYRGSGLEKQRWVDPRELGVPGLDPARVGVRTRGPGIDRAAFEVSGGTTGVVAFYASQPDETTPELPFATEGSPEPLKCGLFSYTLCEALTPFSSMTLGPARTVPVALTYRGLMRRVQERYAGLSLNSPTPMLEGGGGDRPVLGVGSSGETRLVLSRGSERPGSWSLNAGRVQGLEPGAILAVHRPDDVEASNLIGHVKVLGPGLRPLDSRVIACDRAGNPLTLAIPEGAVCRPVSLPYGDRPLRVAVDPRDELGRPIAIDELSRLKASLRGAAAALTGRGQDVLEVVDSPAGSELSLRVEPALGGGTYLVPGEGWPVADPKRGCPPLYGPIPPEGQTISWLEENLMRLFVARRLKRVASDEERRATLGPRTPGMPNVALELIKFDGVDDLDGRVVSALGGGIKLYPEEIVGFRLTNRGRGEADVTLLFVDGGSGIRSLPFRDASNRLGVSETKATRRFKVSGDPLGLESAIAIAVAARPNQPLADFSFLEQTSIQAAKAHATRGRDSGGRDFGSPLGRLLQNCCFGSGTRSGATIDELDDYQIQMLHWRTLARPVAEN